MMRYRYEIVGASTEAANNVEPPNRWSEVELKSWLVSHTADIHSGKKVDVEVDLFEQGFDRCGILPLDLPP
jgi:hypothetical protein